MNLPPKGDYELIFFEPGDYQDPHGNTWCNAAFKGVSEPVRWVVKDPTQITVGQTYYGYFTLETGRGSGKEYIRFRREQKPEEGAKLLSPSPSHPPKKEWQPRDDDRIAAQWALGRSYERNGATEVAIKEAQWLFASLDRVKISEAADAPLVVSQAVTSGYDKFQQSRPKTEALDPEFASMLAKGFEAEGVDPDEIPPEFR